MYEKPTIEIIYLLQTDVIVLSGGGSNWEDWEDENVDGGGWV